MIKSTHLRLPSAGQLMLLSLALAILGGKFLLIDRYGSDLPFWDQWDAEGNALLIPHLEGRLAPSDLFRAHNEHRPMFTRLLALQLFELGGRHWDARVQLVFNAILHTIPALLLASLALRALPSFAAAGFAVFTALLFAAPVSWENTLAGFQSQFYFVLLFSALHLAGTLLARPRSWQWWLAPLAGAAALFSTAAGLLSALAVLCAVAARAWRDHRLTRDDLFVFATNAMLVASGWMLKVEVPGHASLRAAGMGGWLDAWLHQLAWPVPSIIGAPLGLLPPIVLAIAYFRRRIDDRFALVLLGASAWFLLQTAAIAYARGAVDHGYASRYCDTLAVGTLGGLLSLTYLAGNGRANRRCWWAAVTIFAGATVAGFWHQIDLVRENTLKVMPAVNAARIARVRDYLASRSPAFFSRTPWSELPYPSAVHLASLLDTPVLRATLPASVRPPVPLAPDPTLTRNFAILGATSPPGPPPATLVAWSSQPDRSGRFISEEFYVDYSRVSLFIAGDGDGQTEMRLIDERDLAHEPLGQLAPHARWKRINFNVATGRYRLEVTRNGPGWFAFTQPTTNSRVSVFARKIVHTGPWLILSSFVFGSISFLGLILQKVRPSVCSETTSP